MGGHVLGIVGVGHLGEAVARGFAGQSQSLRLALSPRSRERTQRLAQLDGVSVCADTQEVLDTTEVVVLALPRSSIVATCQTQRFAPGQLVISVAAGVKHAQLLSALGPATLVRAASKLSSLNVGGGVLGGGAGGCDRFAPPCF